MHGCGLRCAMSNSSGGACMLAASSLRENWLLHASSHFLYLNKPNFYSVGADDGFREPVVQHCRGQELHRNGCCCMHSDRRATSRGGVEGIQSPMFTAFA